MCALNFNTFPTLFTNHTILLLTPCHYLLLHFTSKPHYPFTLLLVISYSHPSLLNHTIFLPYSLSYPTLTLPYQTTLSFYPTHCHILLSHFPTKPHYSFTLLLVISYSHTSLPNHTILLPYSLSYPTLILPYQTILSFYPTPCHILLSPFPTKPHFLLPYSLSNPSRTPSYQTTISFYPTPCPILLSPFPTKLHYPFTLLIVISYSHTSLPNHIILLPFSLSNPSRTYSLPFYYPYPQ